MSFLCISLNIITVKPVVSKRVQRRNVVELLNMFSSEEELKKNAQPIRVNKSELM